MTLGAMWVRHYAKASTELVVASDSRLTGGKVWDQCPKVFPLSRGDAILSFSGETDYAYPMVQHAVSALDLREESANRRITLESTVGYLKRVLNGVLESADVSGLSSPPVGEETFLLVGGYSWKRQRWMISQISWDPGTNDFRHSALRMRHDGQRGAIRWTGDRDVVGEAKKRLNRGLRALGKSAASDGLNMEPLRVIRDISRDPDFPTVGGAVQVGKVYRNLHSRLLVVGWATEDGGQKQDTLQGRVLLPSERADRLGRIDADEPDVFA